MNKVTNFPTKWVRQAVLDYFDAGYKNQAKGLKMDKNRGDIVAKPWKTMLTYQVYGRSATQQS